MTAIILRGDARQLPLPDECVDLIVTSPPYFQLRDYRDAGESMAGQIGSEETPAEYLAALWDCTREWMRVLKPEGSIFVNLSDKYSQRVQVRRSSHQPGIFPGKFPEFGETWAQRAAGGATRMPYQNVVTDSGGWVPEKSLIGLPWRYAIGCMDRLGLILRRDIVWSKLSALPESANDRCTTRHEYLFHLVKQGHYYSATNEIREPHSMDAHGLSRRDRTDKRLAAVNGGQTIAGNPLGKLPGSVWELAPAPLNVPEHIAHARCCNGRKRPGCEDGLDHHAAFPPALARKCILGWSPPGICVKCGSGRIPVTHSERVQLRPGDTPGRNSLNGDLVHGFDRRAGTHALNLSRIIGYTCACPTPGAATRPALAVDPFGGTGTTALVADVLGRNAITFDLSADYGWLATWRVNDPGERARALGVPKPPPVPAGQQALFGGDAA